jgi:tRNA pseudouridine32 synthase/23S rRNA pseudouridine746 synthase/23S rRNA pseudouridine1911/1915/1917 synthase
MEFTVEIPSKALEVLRKLYPDSSRRTLQNWLQAGRFTVDGQQIKKENEELAIGQVVRSQTTCKPQLVPGLKILFEDRYLIAIDKPVGLLSVPLDTNELKRHALGLLCNHYDTDQIFAVHRIDRETSGCLLFARGKESEQRMKGLFEEHDLTREYFAIVQGRIKETSGTWESKLLELESLDVVESEEGREAITHFTVIRRSPKYSYLKLQLETGRKHQIRVHCSNAGFPILGDDRYGANEDPIHRLCLHAMKIELIHPFTKKKLSITSPLPFAFKKLGLNLDA